MVKRFTSLSDLERAREDLIGRMNPDKTVIRTCMSTGCRAQKAAKVLEGYREAVREQGLEERVEIRPTGCHGFCEMGPITVVEPANFFYSKVRPRDAGEIVAASAAQGEPVERLLWRDPVSKERTARERDLPIYAKQTKHVTFNSGRIDPTSIDEYIRAGGYSALGKALFSMTPTETVDAVFASGLRGRGGGGFVTGQKWRVCAAAPGDVKYIVANGDEGDPGAFMDRSLMEGDPHSVLEGMIIAAYAVGASRGYIYVREEYPIAIDHLSTAIEQAEQRGLLGEEILGSGFSFTVNISKGAGAFVCGEETALLISIEGRSGVPRSRPPYPAQQGLWGKPTIINNVETFGNVTSILARGADWYSGVGTAGSKGTKVFSLVGKVNNTGLVEVEMGTTLREIIFDIGGGIRKGKAFKAVQTGGPSGGCIPMSRIDMPVDYDSLREAGAIMGSGGMIVMDETSCMVDVARYFIDFLMYESCGKCVPCREGLTQMNHILTGICQGRGRESDVNTLRELAVTMANASQCALGGTAPNPVLSTLRYFRHEYEAHIVDRKCRAGVCKELFSYVIDEEACTGCGVCRLKCPEEAVTGEKKQAHRIDPERCVKCGICFNRCKFDAIRVA